MQEKLKNAIYVPLWILYTQRVILGALAVLQTRYVAPFKDRFKTLFCVVSVKLYTEICWVLFKLQST